MNEIVHVRVSELEKKHHCLKEEVARFARRAYLTPEEQRRITELKKQKLQTKDELFTLRGWL